MGMGDIFGDIFCQTKCCRETVAQGEETPGWHVTERYGKVEEER